MTEEVLKFLSFLWRFAKLMSLVFVCFIVVSIIDYQMNGYVDVKDNWNFAMFGVIIGYLLDYPND